MAQKINLSALAAKKEEPMQIMTQADIAAQPAPPAEIQLSEADRKQVDAYKEKINLLDSQAVVTYGVGAQRQITNFSDNILRKVKNKDAGSVGDTMTELMVNVQSLDIDELGGAKGFFARFNPVNSVKKFMSKYETVAVQIDRIEAKLDEQRMGLLRDIGVFDTLYEKNLEYFHELELLIQAGDEKVEEARNEIIPSLKAEAEAKGDTMSAQLVKDFEDTVDRFEKKVHDLRLSRTIAMQTAPQIRLIQNNDKILVDKIQTAVLNTLPLWKNQIVISLGLQTQSEVLKMQQQINKVTNDLLLKNSEMLKQNTIETAKESEKGIVEIETLKKVNNDLIETLNETIKIHNDGRAARKAAEIELMSLENQLKTTLMSNLPATEKLPEGRE